MFFGSTSWEDLGNFRWEEGDWVTWEDSGDQDALREGISGNMGQQVVGGICTGEKKTGKYMVWFLTSV